MEQNEGIKEIDIELTELRDLVYYLVKESDLCLSTLKYINGQKLNYPLFCELKKHHEGAHLSPSTNIEWRY